MRIIDMTAGRRAQWFDKNHPDVLFVDVRPEVKPDLVMDSRDINSDLGMFDVVVFDPPHVNMGANSDMSKAYGHFTTSQIRELIRGVGVSALRVSHDRTVMLLKWNDHDITLKSVLAMLPGWEPLIAHQVSGRIKRRSETFWVLLRPRSGKLPEPPAEFWESKIEQPDDDDYCYTECRGACGICRR